MHPTAMINGKMFFDTYSESFDNQAAVKILEIGSQDVNGSLRAVAPRNFEYLGVDFVEGKGVDIVLDSPYSLPFENESFDIVVSSSCFEHSEMFWLVFLEIMRVLKPAGLFYLNVPSNGAFHRYPVDCWRFYPDSGGALVSWAKRNNMNAALLESYISNQHMEQWNDFVGVFLKDEQHIAKYPVRTVDRFPDFKNGKKHGAEGFIRYSEHPEDRLKLAVIEQIVNNKIKLD